MRVFLRWYENEIEGWTNPIRKVRAPRVAVEPLDPISFEVLSWMLQTCRRGSMAGDRDAVILLSLLDTGARAAEFLAVNLEDVNQPQGSILIRHGKGRKPRTVYIGWQSRRALRRYLAHRSDMSPVLWTGAEGERLSYGGLRAIMTRRAKTANVRAPSLHSFRRAFALTMLRNGTDIFTLSKLMGHEGVAILQRYLKQTDTDTLAAHRKASPRMA